MKITLAKLNIIQIIVTATILVNLIHLSAYAVDENLTVSYSKEGQQYNIQGEKTPQACS